MSAAELYSSSLTCPLEAVRLTTRSVVDVEATKPRAHLSDTPPFTTASPALSETADAPLLDLRLSHVWLDEQRLRDELSAHPDLYSPSALPPSWAQWYHYCDTSSELGLQHTAQYVFVLDALNFCFWPLPGYEYAELAGSLKVTLLDEPASFSAQRLASLTAEELQRWLQPPSDEQRQTLISHAEQRASGKGDKAEIDSQHLSQCAARPASGQTAIPLLHSRTRALNELGLFLLRHHSGLALHLLRSAPLATSASTFVAHVLAQLSAFRDHCVHPATGQQTFLYKRAQILAADLYGAFQSTSLCQWTDRARLTCFADYRLPQLLASLGLLVYSDELRRLVGQGRELEAGSSVEVSIRAHTVVAVELMVSVMLEKGVALMPLQLDWILWERGESMLSELPPHHRTRTIYY